MAEVPTDLEPVPVRSILDRYSAVLLDAYGVIVDHDGALPEGPAFIRHLTESAIPFAVVTNDMTRSPAEWEAFLESHGMEIPEERIVTSGLLLEEYIESHQLQGAPTLVVGSPAVEGHVARAGATVVPFEPEPQVSAVVVGSSRGFPLIDVLDATISILYRHFDRGDRVHLLLPNPDLVYPAGEGCFGFASGALAALLEEGLRRRYPDRDDLTFVRLGKPHPPIFEAARRIVGEGPTLMIGDQLETDIAGAQNCGLDSALVLTGVTRWTPRVGSPVRPTYLLHGLELE